MKALPLYLAILLFKIAQVFIAIGGVIAAPGVWIVRRYDPAARKRT